MFQVPFVGVRVDKNAALICEIILLQTVLGLNGAVSSQDSPCFVGAISMTGSLIGAGWHSVFVCLFDIASNRVANGLECFFCPSQGSELQGLVQH